MSDETTYLNIADSKNEARCHVPMLLPGSYESLSGEIDHCVNVLDDLINTAMPVKIQ